MEEPSRTQQAEIFLHDELWRAIERVRHECDVTYYQVLGCFEVIKTELLEEGAREDVDE